MAVDVADLATPDATPPGDRILLFIPAYNCANQIGRTIGRIGAAAQAHIADVLVLDNGSADGTPEAAAEALRATGVRRWRVARNVQNYGLGGSHKLAFEAAIAGGFTHVVVLHGDDQADIADFLPALDQRLHHRFDSLLGSRFMRASRLQGYSAGRIVGNLGLNAICSVLTWTAISDVGSGLNLYSTAYLRTRFYEAFEDNLIFPAMMLLYGVFCRSSSSFVPISWREEDQRSNAKAVRQALQIIGLIWPRRDRRVLPAGSAHPPGNREFNVLYQAP